MAMRDFIEQYAKGEFNTALSGNFLVTMYAPPGMFRL
jgi:hypothetical protein